MTSVWDAINKDETFSAYPEPFRLAIQPFVEAMPTVLENLLDQPATLHNFLQAKVDFIRYCMANDYIKTTVNAMGVEQLGGDSLEEMIEMSEDFYSEIEGMLSEIVKDIPSFLNEQGVTEDQVMLSPKFGFNAKVRQLYSKGELTIGKLLEMQPMLILKNTN